MRSVLFPMIAATAVFAFVVAAPTAASAKFKLEEATIADVHKAFKSGELTAKKLVEMYLKRIEAYDQKGPKLNAVIYVNPKALEEAARKITQASSASLFEPDGHCDLVCTVQLGHSLEGLRLPLAGEWRNLAVVSYRTDLYAVGGWTGQSYLAVTEKFSAFPFQIYFPSP